MDAEKTSEFPAATLAQVAPVLRGLLAVPTADDDMPYHPVILKALTGPAALDFAASPEKQAGARPSELSRLDRPPLFLDVSGNYASAVAFRRQVAGQIEAYVAQHGVKPQAVCLPGLGILVVSDSFPDGGQALHNKVALVTGSAGPIGHGICRVLLDRGCYVAVTDLPGERLDAMVGELAESVGERVVGIPLDVTDKASVAAGFERVVQTWGGLDIVVVNAGIALAVALTEMSLEAFQKLEKVNVEGALLTIAESGRLLSLQGTGGDIILISTKNVFAPGAKFGAYSATKAASHQLARIASLELAEFGIRVNMVAPDAVFSDGNYKSGLWATVGPDRMKARGLDQAGLEEYYRNRNLLRARVTAQHVANAVLFFVTHQTPTTGATIPVDGGLPDATPR
jgi:NAD(P)-dependent dehydrogenase (short-subunit alcohol dehydrogenase family)